MTDQPRADPPDQAGLFGAPATPTRPLPLRQMGIGELVDGAFKLYRRDWLALMGITALLLVPVTFIQAWLMQSILITATESFEDFDAMTGQLLVVTLVFAAIQLLLVQPFLIAAITKAAADAYLGERVSIGRTYRFALSRLPAILWITIITTVATLVGFILLIIPGVIAAIRLALAPAILVVEDVRGTSAVGRSWNLTNGHFWRVLGTMFLAGLISTVGVAVVTLPTEFLAATMATDGWFISTVGQVVASVVTTPFSILIIVLLYFDLRVRKEGYDIEVMSQELAPPS
jgi:hypothetical protein